MADSPQRPYVPHRTPTRAQPAISVADFALAKPFVPGADRLGGAAFDAAEMPAAEPGMASIETFLVSPRAADAARPDIIEDELLEEPEELPPLEHFLDPLPPISDYSSSPIAAALETTAANDFPDRPADVRSTGTVDSGWGETDWQRFDWKSAGALGDTEKAQAEASDAWATTDWEVPSPKATERPRAPADAIAMALDQIARRIRTGDLSLPGDGSVADPATIAATLAALLGVRR